MNKRWKIKKEIEIGRGSEIRESNPPHRLGKTLVYLGKSLVLIVFGVVAGYLLTYYSQKLYYCHNINPCANSFCVEFILSKLINKFSDARAFCFY